VRLSWHTTGTQNITGSHVAARNSLHSIKPAVGIQPANNRRLLCASCLQDTHHHVEAGVKHTLTPGFDV
jgi:hypothetical protein